MCDEPHRLPSPRLRLRLRRTTTIVQHTLALSTAFQGRRAYDAYSGPPMSRHRDSGRVSESFNVRWHSVANMATPSVDIMSSPDPLNDTAVSSVLQPSSQRVTRSQRSGRFLSLGSSPRKQTFELDVGDRSSPQKLLVTVEAEDDTGLHSTRRRLFPSSSPSKSARRAFKATTTTVPLRASIEDETSGDPITTPKARGRPRTTNGTPIPGAAKKRRAATPIRKTPRRPRTAAKEAPSGSPTERGAQVTPTPKRRGRPPKNSTAEPSSQVLTEPAQASTSVKPGRRRRRALAPDELVELADVAENASLPAAPAPSEDEVDLVHAPSLTDEDAGTMGPTPEPSPPPEPEGPAKMDGGSEQWMDSASQATTPAASTSRTAWRAKTSSPAAVLSEEVGTTPHRLSDRENPLDEFREEQYHYMPPAASDISSIDDPPAETALRNDTIAQGEDFSMIFMDSIPSLRADLSALTATGPQDDLGSETHQIINNTLESLQLATAQEEESERRTLGEGPVVAVSHMEQRERMQRPAPLLGRESPNPALISSYNKVSRKSSSSPLRHQVLKTNARQTGSSPVGIAHEGGQAVASTRAAGRRASVTIAREESYLYEDSFSEIPHDILEAATPARRDVRTSPVKDAMDLVDEGPENGWEIKEIEELEDSVGRTRHASYASRPSRSDTSRLPTPDDTPPQDEDEDEDDEDEESHEDKSSPHPQILLPSGPSKSPDIHLLSESQRPRIAIERVAATIEATPQHQLSSPGQDPQSLLAEVAQDRLLRPTLSPIVRAGRALQSVTSDPPSPESGGKQLRSPFRSSGSRESFQGQGQGSHQGSGSKTPSNQLSSSQPRSSSPNQSRNDADPFDAPSRSIGQAGFVESLTRSVPGNPEANPEASRSPSRKSDTSSMRVTPPAEEMSWIANEGPISPNLRGDVSLKEAAQNSIKASHDTASMKGISSKADEIQRVGEELDDPPQGRDDEQGKDDEEAQDEKQLQEDETDIWEFEASRESPRSTRQQSFGKRIAAPLHKRATLPSPWMKKTALPRESGATTSTQVSNKLPQPAGISANEPSQATDMDDFSMLAQQRSAQVSRNEPLPPASVEKANGFDLSSFFSSPAALPGMLVAKIFSSPQKAPKRPENRSEEAQATMPTTSLFPELPLQMPPPQSSTRQQLLSPARQDEHRDAGGLVRWDAGLAREEDLEMPTLAQKRNFTPRPRQASQSFFQSSASRQAAMTPPRMQLSHADIKKWRQETSHAQEEASGFCRPLLRPLPPKNASPTKSSLRSPLKPRTPGRVVEFTSSVLSVMDHAQARQQQQEAAASRGAASHWPPAHSMPEPDQENCRHDGADVAMADASPLAKMRHPVPLSQASWTREHWLFLDELLQLRKRGPFDVGYERRADKFLGKTVKSRGEAMMLERWHLDCVDAFKAEVGGWDEGVLAKRLFALIQGERRRRRNSESRSSSVGFH